MSSERRYAMDWVRDIAECLATEEGDPITPIMAKDLVVWATDYMETKKAAPTLGVVRAGGGTRPPVRVVEPESEA